MDKLIFQGPKVTISNDGATIIKLLDIVHPAAKTLTDIAKSQDDEVGDGTTSVVLLACELLKSAKPFVEDGVHPQIIIRGMRKACQFALQAIRDMALSTDSPVVQGEIGFTKRQLLERCASTALNSKLICGQKALFAPMAVDAVMHLDPEMLDLNMIGIKKVAGGSVTVRTAVCFLCCLRDHVPNTM